MAKLAEAAATKYRIPWRIDYVSGSKYLLINGGDEYEHDVTIEGSFVIDSPVSQERMDPGGAVEFIAPRGWTDRDPNVTVRWYRSPGKTGEPLEWRYPLT